MTIGGKLKEWFLKHQRDLPWRRDHSPYRVWVSEVMLQQTQASRVILYFDRWMARFPTIEALAAASQEEVLKLWEGLGYYSRARSLHEAAKYLVAHHEGKLPDSPEALLAIKGLGPYTVGAILSFGFHKRAAAVDGNVIRLLSRLFEITDDISKGATQKKIWQKAEELLPQEEAWIISEAMIELGATVCTPKNPKCFQCPIQAHCKAVANGTEETLPYNSKKMVYEAIFREVAVIIAEGHVLLRQGEEKKIMQGLHEFPYIECTAAGLEIEKIIGHFPLALEHKESLAPIKQSFTKYRATLFPKIFHSIKTAAPPGHFWKSLEEAHSLAFSSGHKKILNIIY